MAKTPRRAVSGGRIDIVDFWRFFAAIMVIFCHIYVIGGIKVQSHFFVEFFFMLSGYFIFRHFQKKEFYRLSVKTKLKNAVSYSWKRYLKVLPYTIPIVVICSTCFAYLLYERTHLFPETLKYLINMLIEPFMFPAHTGILGRWFIVPIWYLSVMMFFTPFISFVAQSKKKEWFLFLAIPIGWIYLSTAAEIHDNFSVSSAMSMIRGIVPMLMGGAIYYLTENLRPQKAGRKKRVLLTVLEVSLYAAMAVAAFTELDTSLIVLLAFFAIFLTVSGFSYTSKIKCKYLSILGGISLPLFMWHFGLIQIATFFNHWGMTRRYVFVFLGSIVLSAIHYAIIYVMTKRRKEGKIFRPTVRAVFKWFILLSLLAVFSLAIIIGIFGARNTFYTKYNPLILIIGVVAFLIIARKSYFYIKSLSIKNDRAAIIACVAYFCLLLAFGLIIRCTPSLDLNHIIVEANRLVEDRNLTVNKYFDYHPHQRPLLLIVYGFFKIASYLPFITGEQLMIVVNVLCVAISAFLLYKTAALRTNRNTAFFILCMFFAWPIFWLKASYYYTDTLVLPFIMLSIFLLTYISKKPKTKQLYISLFFVGLSSYIAYKIRAPGIFVLVAYAVYLVFVDGIKNIFSLQFLKHSLLVGLGLVVGLAGMSASMRVLNFGDSSEKALSPLHYISMGMNPKTGGIYDYGDYVESISAENSAERTKINLERLERRINSAGIKGLTKLFVRKIGEMWSQADTESDQFLGSLSEYYPFSEYIVNNKRSIMLSYYVQIFHLAVLILFFVAMIKTLRCEKLDFVYIFIFGAVLLYLFWEVQPRYSLSFLPAILLMTPAAIIENADKKNRQNNKSILMERGLLAAKILFIGIFVVMSLANYNDYCVETKQIDIIALSNYRNNELSELALKKGDVVTQSFATMIPYNSIALYFGYDTKYPELGKYHVSILLKDEEGNNVASIERSISDIKPYSRNDFLLDTDYGNKKGYITIETDAPAEVSLKTNLSFKEPEGYSYDTLLNGQCWLNDKVYSGGDLRVELFNRTQQSVYTPGFYIAVNVISVAALSFCLFYPYKNNALKLSSHRKKR